VVVGADPLGFPRRIMRAATAAMMIITITIAPAMSSVLEEDELVELDVLEEVAGVLDDTALELLTEDVLGATEVELDVTDEELVTEELVEVEEIDVVALETLDVVVELTMETLSSDCIFNEPK
jgi:hypothetical protein